MNNTFVSPNSLMLSVPITPSAGFTLSSSIFQPQQELQNRKIIAIEAYCDLDIEFDPLNPNTPVLPYAAFRNAYLTLYTSLPPVNAGSGGLQQPGLFYDKIPLVSLRRVQNNDTALTPLPSFAQDIFRIRPTNLAFQKCKVEFPTPISLAEVSSAIFMFHYLDLGDSGEKWMPQ